MSGVYPWRTEIGVFHPKIGVAQMLLISEKYMYAHDHTLSSAPVLFMRTSTPLLTGLTPRASAGFLFGCPALDQVSFTLISLLMSMIFWTFSSGASSLCSPSGTPSYLKKSWYVATTWTASLDFMG